MKGSSRAPITKKADARRLMVRLQTRASVLRLPGHNRLGTEEKRQLADELEDACGLIRRMLKDETPQYDQTAEPDATEADLWGAAP